MCDISWLAVRLSASQEGFWTEELDNITERHCKIKIRIKNVYFIYIIFSFLLYSRIYRSSLVADCLFSFQNHLRWFLVTDIFMSNVYKLSVGILSCFRTTFWSLAKCNVFGIFIYCSKLAELVLFLNVILLGTVKGAWTSTAIYCTKSWRKHSLTGSILFLCY